MLKALGLIGLAALALMAPALIHGAPTGDSGGYNYVWTSQIAAEMARGVVYPRWLPQSFEGLGSPTFYFYPPLAHWLSGAFALITDPRRAISIAALVLLFASGAAMYLWLRPRSSYALLGGCLYMLAPYHLADFYERSALAEFGALAWLPLIALAIERQPRRWAGPLLAVSYAGLICTHLPLALLASAILIPPLVVWRAWREPMVAIRCAAAGAAGLALAGFYLAPALTLQGHTLMDQTMWGPGFEPARKSIFEFFGGEPTPGLYLMTALALEWALVAALALVARRDRFWAWMTLWALACAVGLIPLISLPVLEKVQFPWRALAIAEFVGVTAAIAALPRPAALVTAVVIALQSLVLVGHAALGGLKEPVDPGFIARQVDALEYLPAELRPIPTSRPRPELDQLKGPLVRGPAASVQVANDGSVSLKATADGVVTIRRAKFPRWQVESDQGAVPLLPGPLVNFEARAGETYQLAAVRTPAEVAGGWLSLAGLLLTALLALPPRRRRPSGTPWPSEGFSA